MPKIPHTLREDSTEVGKTEIIFWNMTDTGPDIRLFLEPPVNNSLGYRTNQLF